MEDVASNHKDSRTLFDELARARDVGYEQSTTALKELGSTFNALKKGYDARKSEKQQLQQQQKSLK